MDEDKTYSGCVVIHVDAQGQFVNALSYGDTLAFVMRDDEIVDRLQDNQMHLLPNDVQREVVKRLADRIVEIRLAEHGITETEPSSPEPSTPSTDEVGLAEFVESWRKSKNMSRRSFSRMSGMAYPTLQAIEDRDYGDLQERTIKRLCRMTDTTRSEILEMMRRDGRT